MPIWLQWVMVCTVLVFGVLWVAMFWQSKKMALKSSTLWLEAIASISHLGIAVIGLVYLIGGGK